MEKSFECTAKSQAFILKELTFFALAGVVGFFIITHLWPGGDDIFLAKLIAVIYLYIHLIPCCILHLQYYYFNKETKLIIHGRCMTIKIGEKSHVVPMDQIKSVRIAMVSSLYRGGRHGFCAWDLYHYSVIETDKGDLFVVTCLLVNNLRSFYKDLGLEATKVWMIVPLVRMGRFRPKSVDGW